MVPLDTAIAYVSVMSQEPSAAIPMTRARLFVLIDAFERDIRMILARFVLTEIDETTALGNFYAKTKERQEADSASGSTALTEYLDLREAYDLLNTHRNLLPEELSSEVRELTQNLDRLVEIRRRVMHARPLGVGDSDAAPALLTQFRTRYWTELRRTLAQLDEDPTWEPVVLLKDTAQWTLHNLPLPDYDETGLVGRAKEVEDIMALVQRGREAVITITGEGGIGKTAVALEIAYRLVDDSERPFDAVLWTSLKFERLTAEGVREIADAALDVTGAIRPLGRALDESFGGDLAELAQALEGLRVLVVFDNLETVGGLDFSQLYDALPDSVRYLVTSREGVGEYERRYPLEPLSEVDAIRLFNDFTRSRRVPGLDRVSTGTRTEIVRRLRLSPLAIRWFVLAVEVGREPIALLRDQSELLEFCVRSVYEALGDSAQEILAFLSVLGRPVTADELVVLLDKPADEVNRGLKQLIRGSLIRRNPAAGMSELTMSISLTETASQFVAQRANIDHRLASLVRNKDEQYRAIEERRAEDAASRSLAPVVVRTRTESDVPTAQLLRRALLECHRSNFAAASADLETARRLSPDLWEVDRVDAFITAQRGNVAGATALYESAFAKASDGEEKAVVAHFYAGHLARNVRDLARAVEYARRAHSFFESAETAIPLGNYLVWTHDYEAGIALLGPAADGSTGKVRLIALSALAEAHRRWGERALREERNPLLTYRRSSHGLAIALASLDAGVMDRKLHDIAASCLATALMGLCSATENGTFPQDAIGWLDATSRSLVRLVGTSQWLRIVSAATRLAQGRGAPAGCVRFGQQVASFQQEAATDVALYGEIVTLSTTYGFIRHPSFPSNLFFHRDDLQDGTSIQTLRPGALVSFNVTDSDRGPRAVSVGLSTAS